MPHHGTGQVANALTVEVKIQKIDLLRGCRVEDTDRARSTRESEAAVMEDLKWLGLNWDEGMQILFCMQIEHPS